MATATSTARFELTQLRRLLGATSDGDVARQLHVTRRTIQRWHHDGLSIVQADRAAVAAGYHPANFWPDYFRVAD